MVCTSRSTRLKNQGFTLVEIIAAVVIMSIAAAGIGLSINTITRTELKSSCNRLISAARYAYNRSVINGTTVRLVFDIPSGEFSLQEAHGRIVLAGKTDEILQTGDEQEQGRGVDVDPWKAAKARLQDTFKPSLGTSSFSELKSSGGKSLNRYTKVTLGRRIKIIRLIVPHEPEPKEEGKGAIYFFSGGQTEHAVLHLSDGNKKVYAVEIHPLTGRGKVHSEAYEPVALLGDPDEKEFTEVEAP